MCFDIWATKTGVFLTNYVPKCQMRSGPYGPIFIYFQSQGEQPSVK